MLFYFTATGNSLYVAKQLENDPISIPQEGKRASMKGIQIHPRISFALTLTMDD